MLALLIVLTRLLPHPLQKWQLMLVTLGYMTSYYFGFWPLALRLKPWSEFQYWLPESRLVGYSVYLLLPVALMALLLYAAIRWGT